MKPSRIQVTIEIDTDGTDIAWEEFRAANRVLTAVNDRMPFYHPNLVEFKKVERS